MVVPPNGQYILLCSPVSVILCAFWPSARHDLLAGFDQEFSSRARDRTNTRESIKKLLSIARVVIVPRWKVSIANANICFARERDVVAFLTNLRVLFRFLQFSHFVFLHLISLSRRAACLSGCELQARHYSLRTYDLK